MKKVFLSITVLSLLMFVFSSLTLAANKVTISYDMEGEYEKTHDLFHQHKHSHAPMDVEPGFSIGYEYTHKVRRVELGGGLETQLNRSLAENKDCEFNFTQLYGVIYVDFINEGDMLPFFVGRLGYNKHTCNKDFEREVYGSDLDLGKGIYYAVGFGFNMKRNVLALLYTVNFSNDCTNITIESDGSKDREYHDATYSKISLMYAFKF